MFDWVFAFLHLGALLAILGYAVFSLMNGQTGRAVLIIVCLGLYYFLVLHKGVRREIARRRDLRSKE